MVRSTLWSPYPQYPGSLHTPPHSKPEALRPNCRVISLPLSLAVMQSSVPVSW